jgi:hypothetical protein
MTKQHKYAIKILAAKKVRQYALGAQVFSFGGGGGAGLLWFLL